MNTPNAGLLLSSTASPALRDQVRAAGWPLSDGTGLWWRVPTQTAVRLANQPGVQGVWGLPELTAPPDDADLQPTTPDLTPDAEWRQELQVSSLADWPGGTGIGVVVADVEYDWNPLHEDLVNNPAAAVVGIPARRFAYHGNACVGLIGAADDGFGTTGGAPEAEIVIAPPLFDDRPYDVAEAIFQVTDLLSPGDVILIEQQTRTTLGLSPVSSEPAAAEAIRRAVARGIIVVEPTGNGGVDLDDPSFQGWFSNEGATGSLMVAGASPTGDAGERTNTGRRVDLWARGQDTIAPDDGTVLPHIFWPNNDELQAYTQAFGGSSGASAQVAGLVAALQGVALESTGEPLTPLRLATLLKATGEPSLNGAAIGVRPKAERVIRTYLLP
ncbi:MAG: S8 family serine peptidase [Myxococcota bacterium]